MRGDRDYQSKGTLVQALVLVFVLALAFFVYGLFSPQVGLVICALTITVLAGKLWFRWRVIIMVLYIFFPGSATAEQKPDKGVGAIRQPRFTEEGVPACLICHFGERMQAVARSPHGNTQIPNTPYSLKACESCHGPGSFHVSRAHGGKGFPPLITFGDGSGASSRENQVSSCLDCHEDQDRGTPVIGFTDSAHNLSSINCSSCHEMHTDQQQVSNRALQASICLRCHFKDETEHPLIRGRSIDVGSKRCSNCHDVHPALNDED